MFQNFEIFENGTNESIDLEAHLEPSRISAMELFCENSYRQKAFNNFRKNVPL